jgi:hypothetical protein
MFITDRNFNTAVVEVTDWQTYDEQRSLNTHLTSSSAILSLVYMFWEPKTKHQIFTEYPR